MRVRGIFLPFLAVLLASCLVPSGAGADVPQRPTSGGFYPIWEGTGQVEPHRSLYFGTNGAQLGIRDWAQVGFQPVNYYYRTPNFSFKFLLPLESPWSTTLQVSAYYLLEMASRATLSPMYSARLDNPDFGVFLFPVSVAASRAFSDWLVVHQTATALGLFTSGALQNGLSLGYSFVAEFLAAPRHSVSAHFTEVGFWSHDHLMVGTSYRWQGDSLEFRLGYFYRIRTGSAQGAPLMAVGWHW